MKTGNARLSTAGDASYHAFMIWGNAERPDFNGLSDASSPPTDQERFAFNEAAAVISRSPNGWGGLLLMEERDLPGEADAVRSVAVSSGASGLITGGLGGSGQPPFSVFVRSSRPAHVDQLVLAVVEGAEPPPPGVEVLGGAESAASGGTASAAAELVGADNLQRWRERALNLVEELAGERVSSSDSDEAVAAELALAAIRGLRPYVHSDVPETRREQWHAVIEATIAFVPKGREGLGLVSALKDLARSYGFRTS